MPLRFSALAFGVVLLITSCGIGSNSGTTPTPSTVTVTAGPPSPSPPPPGPTAPTPIVGSVLAHPMPVAGTDGKTHLAYELVLTNASHQHVTITSVSAVAGGNRLLTLSGDQVGAWTRLVGSPSNTPTIGPAQSALVWLDIVVDDASIPTDISHIVGVSVAAPQPPLTSPTMTETIAPTVVDNRKPVTIAPPLAGGDWLDVNGCCGMSLHRTAVTALNGQLWASQRYAIDYVRLTPDGRLFSGEKGDLASYPGFGADVFAVADGPVVALADNVAEQIPGAVTPLPLEQYAGNRVIQDIGGGNYVMYAHLQTGSIAVKVGERLTTGQVLGAVGNSGNTSGPHLYFQVMSEPDPLRANGLPFLFDKSRLTSRLAVPPGDDGRPGEPQHGIAPVEKSFLMPLALDVMTYPYR